MLTLPSKIRTPLSNKHEFGQIKFKSPTGLPFTTTLRQRVDAYFKNNNLSKHANSSMKVKTAVLIAAYVLPYAFMPLVPFGVQLVFWAIMGVAIAGIGMNIMHDAIHGSYSSNPKVNKWLGYTLNFAGAGTLNWKLQHNVLHHTFTNVTHADNDIQDIALLKFSPHTSVKWFHKYQWIFAPFFYGLITINWVYRKDFKQFKEFKNRGVNTQSQRENSIYYTKMVLMKLVYTLFFLVIPILFWQTAVWKILVGFMFMHFIAGNIISIVFQLAHVVEHTHFPMPNDEGVIENEWAIHQLQTTANFSRKSKWISWYVGGLNFQIEHHLFPKISHVHYPAISEIVKSTAKDFNLNYVENETFYDAFLSHVRLLKQLGLPKMNEIMA